MDRRAALAKLGGGAAVAAGAAIVSSAPAFADFGSPLCSPLDCTTPFSITLIKVGPTANPDYVDVMVPAASYGCPAGHTPSLIYKYRVTRIDGGGTASNAPHVKTCPPPTPSTLASSGAWTGWLGSRVCLLNGNSNTNLNNGDYRIEVIERRVCTNTVSGRVCWCCVGQFATFRMQGNMLTVLSAGALAAGVTAGECD